MPEADDKTPELSAHRNAEGLFERPNHPDWDLLVEVTKVHDQEQAEVEAQKGEPLIILPEDTDMYSVAYMSQQRVIRSRKRVPDDGDYEAATGREASIWVDGFTLGMRFAAARQQGLATEFATDFDNLIGGANKTDGNRRQRRAKGKR